MGARDREPGPLGPYVGAVAITPSDSAFVPGGEVSALMCTGAGNVAVQLRDGSQVTLAITAGFLNRLPLSITKVLTTGTTATGLTGFV